MYYSYSILKLRKKGEKGAASPSGGFVFYPLEFYTTDCKQISVKIMKIRKKRKSRKAKYKSLSEKSTTENPGNFKITFSL